MKANELMLGDWVYGLYPNGKRYEPPFRISAVDIYPTNRSPRIVTEGGYGFQEEHLAPIPLTPEILEKNGIHYHNENNTYYWLNRKSFREFIQLEYASGGIWQVLCKGRLGHTRNSFGYIHQLQHALRLCGIEKEIVL